MANGKRNDRTNPRSVGLLRLSTARAGSPELGSRQIDRRPKDRPSRKTRGLLRPRGLSYQKEDRDPRFGSCFHFPPVGGREGPNWVRPPPSPEPQTIGIGLEPSRALQSFSLGP
ncbi:hypothetical protein KQX54_017190 [Cotesia glomerata]|uniref:Uncharacterized protein n=1 Tax=Cotesia glomerata TaxID=32391 RepID=A0AAV7HTW0_COTGL|nr:hypothetical protein KQX54_017190 [Cotesia glomerata]